MIESTDVIARVECWLERAVIGLGLCPFAREVWTAKSVRIVASETRDFDQAVRATLLEVRTLLEAPPEEISTILVVFPFALSDFETFLDAAAAVEAALEAVGANGIVQIATFHPDYCFEGVAPEDLSNFTNRAPFAILHILREDQVTQAVDTHPDAASIPATNIARLTEMGLAEIRTLWRMFE